MGMISAFYQIESVLIAVGITAFVCLGVTLFSFQTKYDFTSCGGVLFVISLALFAFGIVCIFTSSRVRLDELLLSIPCWFSLASLHSLRRSGSFGLLRGENCSLLLVWMSMFVCWLSSWQLTLNWSWEENDTRSALKIISSPRWCCTSTSFTSSCTFSLCSAVENNSFFSLSLFIYSRSLNTTYFSWSFDVGFPSFPCSLVSISPPPLVHSWSCPFFFSSINPFFSLFLEERMENRRECFTRFPRPPNRWREKDSTLSASLIIEEREWRRRPHYSKRMRLRGYRSLTPLCFGGLCVVLLALFLVYSVFHFISQWLIYQHFISTYRFSSVPFWNDSRLRWNVSDILHPSLERGVNEVQLKNKTLAIAACCRNVFSSLPGFRRNVQMISELFADTHFFLGESFSTDSTRDYLLQWQQNDSKHLHLSLEPEQRFTFQARTFSFPSFFSLSQKLRLSLAWRERQILIYCQWLAEKWKREGLLFELIQYQCVCLFPCPLKRDDIDDFIAMS